MYVECLEAHMAQSQCCVSTKNHYDDYSGGSNGGVVMVVNDNPKVYENV